MAKTTALLLALTLLSAAAPRAFAADAAVVESEFIYEKGPPPRCHASTIVETGQGLVVALFGGTDEGETDVGIWVARHDGKAWSRPVEVVNGASDDGKRYPCWNPVLFNAGGGKPLLLFYKVGPSPSEWWGMLVTSGDAGKTWSKPQRLPDGILGPIKNKPVLLEDGTLLCGSSTEHDGWRLHMEWTKDLGKTWDKTGPLNDGKGIGVIQPAILTHKDGKLQTLCRTQQGKVGESWSEDGGKTWSDVKLTELPNPNSGLDAVTLADGRHLLVYNPTTRGRTPLSIAVSENGKSWKAGPVLETEPGEYSYPAVIQSGDGMVHVTYTWKRDLIRHAVIDPAKMQLKPLAAAAAPKADQDVQGTWLGTLEIGAIKLRVAFKVTRGPDGKLAATLDSIDQGANGIPVDSATFDPADGSVNFHVKAVAGHYGGYLSADGTAIDGEWEQAGGRLPLVLKKVDALPTVARPQEPKKPYPYREEQVTYENAKAGVKFAGTLTLPAQDKAKGPYPAVLLITGSGPQDRDEMVMNHRPFLILADYLTRRGIAVLRVDDRGVGGTTAGNKPESDTTADYATDALAGVAFLKTRKDVDPKRIGLIGHSEGGLVAPLAAAESKDVAFVVLLAPPGVPGEQIMYMQGQAIARAMGADDKRLARARRTQEKMFAILQQEKDSAVVDRKLREMVDEESKDLSEQEKKLLEAQKTAMDAQFKAVQSAWFRFFLTHDPRPVLGKVSCPVLAVIGEKDLQVPPKENLPEVEKALRAGGNKDVTVKELKGLNHLFQTATTGSPTEYATIEETFAPAALKEIGDWIEARVKR